MTFKVAVATTDRENVNEHFGKAKEFLIYEITDNGNFNLLEIRENNPPCSGGGHTQDIMNETIKLIQDVKLS